MAASIGLEASLNMMPSLMASSGNGNHLHYLNHDHGLASEHVNSLSADGLNEPQDLLHINNNNNMVSASPSSSISPLNSLQQPDLIPQTSVALAAAAAAAAVSSMASMEAIGFDQQAMPPLPKLEKSSSTAGEGSSPKYISL